MRQIYVPSNGYFTERMVKQITETLKEPSLDLFVAELSLDGTPEFHDETFASLRINEDSNVSHYRIEPRPTFSMGRLEWRRR